MVITCSTFWQNGCPKCVYWVGVTELACDMLRKRAEVEKAKRKFSSYAQALMVRVSPRWEWSYWCAMLYRPNTPL